MAFLEQEFNITVRDINQKSELTNKAILSFFEDMGGFHSNLAGYGLKDLEKTKLSWVLLNWKIKVLKKIKYIDGPIRVKTWSRGAVRACTFRDFEAYNKKGELCIVGTSKWTLIHLEKGLVRLTDEILEKYEPEEKVVLPNFDFKKLPEIENYSNIYNYTVLRRDIDINSHMHNLCYLDLAYEALPKDVYENTSFCDIEIMYKKEALLGDKLKCLYSFVDNNHFVTIKSEDGTTLHAIVKLL